MCNFLITGGTNSGSNLALPRLRWCRLLALLFLYACPSTAAAAPVLVLGPGRQVRVVDDPFVPAATAAPAPVTARARVAVATPKAPEKTMLSELLRLYEAGQITLHDYHSYKGSFNAALATVKRLAGTRAAELQSVVTTLHDIAATGQLTASRLPALFLTLNRNRQWWTTGPIPAADQRIQFTGSQIVYQYYPGQGIQIQALGTFGEANGFYTAGRSMYPALKQVLAEMLPLAAERAGGLAWEYYFSFDGGAPPWTSAMSQATGIEALTRAFKAFDDPSYLAIAKQGLPLFHAQPPLGVAVPTSAGTRYVQYTFAPGASILNAFLQSLIGLYDYSQASGDHDAAALFAAGDAEARGEIPGFVSGTWSLYQTGVPDTLDYHTLVTGFLQALCTRVQAPAYCDTANLFQSDLTTPPALTLVTHNTRKGLPTRITFTVSAPSHVGIVVLRGSQTLFLTSADFNGGTCSFSIGKPSQTGPLTIHLAATDLAGTFNRIVGTLQVG
jgi:hypothetical protein